MGYNQHLDYLLLIVMAQMAKSRFEADIQIGKENDVKYMKHSLLVDGNILGGITKHYYEIIDNVLIENMPDDILDDMIDKMTKEKIRRGQ